MCSLELKPQIKQKSFFLEGKEKGWRALFSRNISWLFVSPSPPLQSCWRAQQGQRSLHQERFDEVVAYVQDIVTWYMEATDLNGTVCIEMGLGSGSLVVVLLKV